MQWRRWSMGEILLSMQLGVSEGGRCSLLRGHIALPAVDCTAMKLTLPRLNGWMRLYIVVVAGWVTYATYSFILVLPGWPDAESLEIRALAQITSEIDDIRRTPSIDARFRRADQFCEIAYDTGKFNKNECMEFLMNPGKREATADAILAVSIASQMKSSRTKILKSESRDRYQAALAQYLPSYVWQLVGIPFVLLVVGYAIAWIRRGFE